MLAAQPKTGNKKNVPPSLSPAAVFEAFVQHELARWQTPGLSVAVVKDGQIVFNKGYGLRELGKPDLFETNTLAEAASTTKAMTALCMALLVEEGKVRWTDKVAAVYPDFELFDPYLTKEITVRDLFTHNAGLGNADFLWYGNTLSQDEIVRKLRYLKPAYSLRGSYTYQNIMYLVAGKVIEKLSGQTWENFMVDRIFKPLGMNRSFPSFAYAQTASNRTSQHFAIQDTVHVIPLASVDRIPPAGAVWTCADDMAKWMLFLLDSTKVRQGKRLIQPASFAELFKPQAIIPSEMFYPTAQLTKPNWTTYGLGWFQQDYRGKMIQFHTGSIDGAVALVGLIPDAHVGICVFANLDHAELRHALLYTALDLWAFGDNKRDWGTEIFDLYKKSRDEAKQKELEKASKKVLGTKPSLSLAGYAGNYADPLYGRAKVEYKNNVLRLTINELNLYLEHWHYDTFKGHYEQRWVGNEWVQFSLDADGKVSAMTLPNMRFQKID